MKTIVGCVTTNPTNPNIQNKMKATIATAILIISLLGARVTAADSPPVVLSVEQQFQQADVQLAIEQYKKLRMAAFDLSLKLQTETTQSEE
jgi:hypothetical protein